MESEGYLWLVKEETTTTFFGFLTRILLVIALLSIDDDILNLVDDFNIDAFVKEASVALEDEKKLWKFIREKATVTVERFLVRNSHFHVSSILLASVASASCFSLTTLIRSPSFLRTTFRKCRSR